MKKYRKILIAYDGSVSGEHVLRQACRLAKEDKSWLKLVVAVPKFEGDLELVGIKNIKETIAGPFKESLIKAKAIAEEEDVHILTNLTQGEPYESIVHTADDENCDLIVMGRKGHSHVERTLVGGVTSRVIGHTQRDVIVVPDQGVIDWSRILVATDGSQYSQSAVDLAFEIAKERGSTLNVLTVAHTNEEHFALAPHEHETLLVNAQKHLDFLQEKGKEHGVELQTIIKEGEPYECICDYANETKASLILMGSHGRKGLTRLLMGSVTEHVVGLAKVPVLVRHLQQSSMK